MADATKSVTKFVARPVFRQTGPQRSPAPLPHSVKNPTISGLFSATDRSDWVEHRVPMITSPGNVLFESIFLNKQKYEPGKSYQVPPIVDAELSRAEQRFRDSITKQITGNDMNTPGLKGEIEAQKAFDLRRRAREAAGVLAAA